jgi:hypothetical protein
MSEITQNFVVEPNNINITVDTNNINFTPNPTQLSIFTSGPASVGGSNTQLQYNNNNSFGGIPNVTWNGSNLSLGNVANIKITGGTNGYVLQTDGVGNLTWTAQTGGGTGTPGGSTAQIQYNDSGLFGGTAGFTFDSITGNVNMPGNLIVVGNIFGTFTGNANYANFAGQIIDSSQPNITSVGTLTNLSIANTLSVGGTTTIQQAKEKVTANATGSTGTINYDLLTQAIILKTANATANFVLNFRGNNTTTLDTVMSSNQSLTCTFINTNGANGYYATSIQIDSTTVTPNWVYPGAPTVGTTVGQDVYTFNIIKTAANTYNVLAAKTGFV